MSDEIPADDAERLAEVGHLLESLQQRCWQEGFEAALEENGGLQAVTVFELGRKIGAMQIADTEAWREGYVSAVKVFSEAGLYTEPTRRYRRTGAAFTQSRSRPPSYRPRSFGMASR